MAESETSEADAGSVRHNDAYIDALEGQRNRLWHSIEMALDELLRPESHTDTAVAILQNALKAKCTACAVDDHEHCANFRGLAVARQGTPEYKLMEAIFGKEVEGCCCEHE